MRAKFLFGSALIFSVAITQARQHPSLFLNQAEIKAIMAKAKSGAQPWKGAMDKSLRAADASLKAGPWKVANHILDCNATAKATAGAMRLEMSQFGYALKNMALAWYYTGDKKYADRAIYLVNVWFFDAATYMSPNHSRGLLGASSDFQHVIYGVDLFWPAFPPEMQRRLKDWFNQYSKSVVKVENGYSGGVGGGSNRADWGCSMMMTSGIMGDHAEGIANGIERFKRRPVRPSGELTGVQSGKICMYSFFTVIALFNIAEAARHNGVDLYAYDMVDGKSRIERISDYYARYAFNADLWAKEHRSTADDCRGFESGTGVGYYEIANAYREKPAYMQIINKLGRPVSQTSGQIGRGPMDPLTLTHARGGYPLMVYKEDGQVLGSIGSAATAGLVPDAAQGFTASRAGIRLVVGANSLLISVPNPGKASTLYHLDGRRYPPAGSMKGKADGAGWVSGQSGQWIGDR